VEPREFLTHYDHQPCSRSVSKASARIVDTVDWNGRSLLQVETAPVPWPEDGWSGKVQLLIDPKRGFALARRSNLIQHGPDEEWREYIMVEVADFKEISPGLWVPTRAKYEWKATGTGNKLMSRQELRFKQWDLKPNLSDSTFHFEFPAEVRVTDEREPEPTALEAEKDSVGITDAEAKLRDEEKSCEASDSAGKAESVTVRGRIARQDVKKIVELAEQVPGITQRIASLRLMKDGEVWAATTRRSGESSLIIVKHTGDEWELADTITIRGQLPEEDVKAVILYMRESMRWWPEVECVASLELMESGEVWIMTGRSDGGNSLTVLDHSGNSWGFIASFRIPDQLPEEDLKAIVLLVGQTPGVRDPRRVLRLEVTDKGEARVMTGHPMASGHDVTVSKTSGKWKVKSVGRWVE